MDVTKGAIPSVRQEATTEQPALRFDWIVALLLAIFIFGAYLDSWAHNHLADELETFFTPWHAVLYSGFTLAAGYHILTLYRNVNRGIPFRNALPQGYRLSLLGILIFFVGAVGDMVWHELFGIEVGIEGMISPTHLLLICGAALVYSGPLRSAWQRTDLKPTWSDMGPAILSLLYVYSLFTLPGQFAFLPVQFDAIVQPYPASVVNRIDFYGVGAVALHTVMMAGLLLLAIRRWWKLPFGTFTLIMTVNACLVFFTRYKFAAGYELMLPATFIAGLFADWLLHTLKPGLENRAAYRIFAFLLPFSYFLLQFIVLLLTHEIRWTIHVWTGVTVLSGLIGFALSIAFLTPKIPDPVQSDASDV